MIGLPSLHGFASILLAGAMFYGFASGKARVEIISLLTIGVIALGLYFFPLPGTAPNDGLALAFGGFGHHALITICALMILGRGLVVTGALEPAARALNRVWRLNRQLGLLVTLMLALALSMMINDTPVLVLLLPILAQLANQGGMPASKTLIPVNSAILIGGMATTIGTSTNLLVVSIATDMGMAPIGVFHFTGIVLTAALVALPYLWLVMPRLLPDNSRAANPDLRHYCATLRVGEETPAFGKTADQFIAMLPAGVQIDGPLPDRIAPGTRINLSGPQEALTEAARKLGATLAPPWLLARLRQEADAARQDLALVEMTIAPDSRLIGLTLQSAGLEGVAVLGIHQARGFLHQARARTAEAPLREGDVLLVIAAADTAQDFAARDGLLVLEGGREMPRSGKAGLALAIMAGSVGVASIGLMPIAISALAGAVLMFVTGCVKFERVGRALSAQVIVLVAASIALGKLVLVTGAAEWLGQLLAIGLQFLPAAGVLAAMMLFVTVLTNFASNATAAAVGTPIAFSLAQSLGLPAEPLVLAVLFGCNLCYATPVAYQTNMMIMSEGDYVFRDYVRTGLPLVILMVVTLSTLLVLRYDL
ncbi:SLC13 family permease [Novosphingobium sp.]|uniref:SLC13 family permease n=1 Tax=Novosphingobium sp. TaxID=1874826 RepID=UPI0027333196|nr:SLC13 family permease [Novosphingobium sp.]MDP3906411.1 SLC13 family permease [Novosphingobium sp.]